MADKYDDRKPRVDLVPPHALLAVADVMTYGADKYAAWNFLEGEGLEFSRLTRPRSGTCSRFNAVRTRMARAGFRIWRMQRAAS